MTTNRFDLQLGWALLSIVAVTGCLASEHHGTVKSGGLPIPGATVTVSKGDLKQFTTTDERGVYSFGDLADGVWSLRVEMLGFVPAVHEVAISAGAPAPEWDLKFLPPGSLAASRATPPRQPAREARAGGPMAPPSQESGRPAMRRPAGAPQQAEAGFRRLDVNVSANTVPNSESGTAGDLASPDLTQSASDSLLVNGSVSRGLDIPPQDDWLIGRQMMLMDGMGGPGMGMGPAAEGPGAAPGGVAQVAIAGGTGGGAAGGPGGGPGGGLRGGPGGFGGPGGMMRGGAGRGGPAGRPGVAAFGNARRDRRMQYNGNASFSLDNSVWDARSYSLTGQDTEKPAFARARASLMFGGPLKIPKLLSGRNGMFTINYQLGRTRNGTTQSALVPTALERAGDFSQSVGQQGLVTIFDPTTGQPFAGNAIPASRIRFAALGLLRYYPLPNSSGSSQYNYQTAIVNTSNQDNLNTRLNQTLNSKNRLSGGFGYQRSNTSTPNLFQFVDAGKMHGYNANIGWTHNFAARLISNLNYRFSRSTNEALPYFSNRENVAGDLGITGTYQSAPYWGPPSLNFTNGFASLSDQNANASRNQTQDVSESIIWIRGKHNFNTGFSFRRQQLNTVTQQNPRGSFAFTGSATSNTALSGSGFDLADLLLGLPSTSAIAYGNADKYFRASGYTAHFNDDWRISDKVTLNYGIRYDYGAPLTELYGRLVSLDFAPGFSAIAQVLPGQTGPLSGIHFPQSLIHPDRNNFSPRIGIAWRPAGRRSTVIRAGYGIYYNTSAYNAIANSMAQQPPLSVAWSVAASASNPLTLENGFPLSTATGTTNTFAIDPNYRVGYAQTWTVAVQHSLPMAMFATVSYLGTKGTRLDQQYLPNSVPAGYAGLVTEPAGYTYQQSNGNSVYHAAQFQLGRRFRSGFSGDVFYTFSKSIDNAATGGGAVVAQDWTNLSAERALSSFNRTHVLNLMAQFSSGFGRRGGTLVNGWKGALLKDWTLQSNISISSGAPLTATAGGIRSVTGGTGIIGSTRADATGLSLDAAAAGQPFNLAAFALPATGTFGNAGRNTIAGPSSFSLNGSVGRVFRLGERRSADLRFEATNALNHVNFRGWNTTVGTTQYGALIGPGAMRNLTANLRFRF
jgi:hypothetical protein